MATVFGFPLVDFDAVAAGTHVVNAVCRECGNPIESIPADWYTAQRISSGEIAPSRRRWCYDCEEADRARVAADRWSRRMDGTYRCPACPPTGVPGSRCVPPLPARPTDHPDEDATDSGCRPRPGVLGYRAETPDGSRDAYYYEEPCRRCHPVYDPARQAGVPCLDPYAHALETAMRWKNNGHAAHVVPVHAPGEPSE